MVVPLLEGQRQFAVVPRTPATQALAKRLGARALAAGIEIVLVDRDGMVLSVKPSRAIAAMNAVITPKRTDRDDSTSP